MVWDLGKAMHKKEEFESARLLDFEFRQRARAARLLALEFGLDEAWLARETVLIDDDAVAALAASRSGRNLEEVKAVHLRCHAEARRELIGERGDPTPHRLG